MRVELDEFAEFIRLARTPGCDPLTVAERVRADRRMGEEHRLVVAENRRLCDRRYRERHRAERSAYGSRWQREHPEAKRRASRAWYRRLKADPGRYAAYLAKRREQHRKRTNRKKAAQTAGKEST